MWTKQGRAFSGVGYVSKRGEVIIHADMFPNTKFGYNGREFLISTLHFAPFVVKTEVNGTAHYGGICMDLLKDLAWRLNFTYTLTEPPDQTWGRPGPNNTFNGMIGQLQREEVDIVAADTTIQKERELVMDFMFPFYYGYTSVMVKKPDPNARKWRTLVDPLHWKVLMTIGICLPIMSFILSLLERYNPFYARTDDGVDYSWLNVFQSFTHSLWYMYGTLFAQGSVILPQTVAGRTLICSWWLFSIVIVGTYCGNLIAFLTVTKDKPPFETLDEMADLKGTYQWGLQGGTNREFVFETSKRPEFRRVGDAIAEFSKKDPAVLATDFDVQLEKVKKGWYGWIGDAVVMELEMAKDCDLMMIKDKFLPLRYAFGFTNNSPHEQIFTKQMLVIQESGLIEVWKRRWWPKSKAICADSIVAEAKPISIIDVQSAFYVAAGGAVISFCIFVVEVIIGKYCRGRRQRRKSR
ncbi:glutamate receptor ionotropic, kainate glr-3-like [Ruditapes philippinarum]|uniref:glutamate receptor ionotropic, kainate glr-3-like n=1 Tax=Ruditapes philippinarum TaxID=129788 RepID=UPI00295A617E|nr:glutamate receptor ionotropic, kainate glr-3-like [Ruditapes philippinarum]